jgi:hypothetical protein
MDDLGNVFGAKFNYVNNSGELGDLIERGFDDYRREQWSNRFKLLRNKIVPLILGTQIFFTVACDDGCKTSNSVNPLPESKIYYISAEAKEITEHFPALNDSQIKIGHEIVSPGEQVVYDTGVYGNFVEINASGGHDAVMVIRGGYDNTFNLYQSQNGESVIINIPLLGSNARQGEQVRLEIYKIPSSINIADVKEALMEGTAVYDKEVTFYPVNEGYSEKEFENVKEYIRSKVDNIFDQLNTIPGMKGCKYDSNKTDGKQRIRLSPDYINPGHAESGSGVIDWSEIKISKKAPIDVFLEELYQAMGVRNDIGIDNSIRDDISGYTGKLNQFGRDLMVINYFLKPGTKL